MEIKTEKSYGTINGSKENYFLGAKIFKYSKSEKRFVMGLKLRLYANTRERLSWMDDTGNIFYYPNHKTVHRLMGVLIHNYL